MMEDELAHLQDSIERYRKILRAVIDERLRRELENMIREAERKLDEIERQGERSEV